MQGSSIVEWRGDRFRHARLERIDTFLMFRLKSVIVTMLQSVLHAAIDKMNEQTARAHLLVENEETDKRSYLKRAGQTESYDAL